MREGDPSGPVYVVRTGRLRVFRRDLTVVDGVIDLATLGAGDVIGELGPILGQPRSASVQALEPTEVLEIPADQLPSMVLQHQPLQRVIVTALRERAGLPDGEIAALTARLGLSLPLRTTNAQTEMEHTPGPLVPKHDPAVVYPKTVDCPSCGTRFSALTVHPRKDQPAERESDFHNIYPSSHNPYDYEVWVCPNDLYAALPVDFADPGEKHRRHVPPAVTHRLAWCARERGDTASEQAWLGRALEHYRTAYSEADLGGAQEELCIQFLCGELTLRLGDVNGAVTWFTQALRHPGLKEHANWERMLREQWAVARETTQLGPG